MMPEAMVAAIPVTSTDFSTQGLDITNGKELIVASSAKMYSDKINTQPAMLALIFIGLLNIDEGFIKISSGVL